MKATAEQMLVFNDDESYILYQTMIQISNLLMMFEISKSELILLQILIEEHHEIYIKLFKDGLKPKIHNMLHYKEVILFVLVHAT